MIYADGSKYEGNWKNDMRDGQGKYISETGVINRGNWLDNIFLIS